LELQRKKDDVLFRGTGLRSNSKVNMEKKIRIIDVNEKNVSETGFFCYMSKRKSIGFQKKLKWLKERFAEGMRIKMLQLPPRGFIEYIPGEFAWRPVNAKGYMFIHCLWIVGQSKGKGLASLLLNQCIKDAKKMGKKGVVMVTSEGGWLVGKKFLIKHGFVSVDSAPPSFELMVKKFGNAPSPSFTGDWERKLSQCGKGLTIFRSDQCPYIEDCVNAVSEIAKGLGIKCTVIELKNSLDVRNLVPSAFGVFSIVYDGDLVTYHYILKEDLINRLT
jgi:GNAT superfamily N-acetyltransferase